MAKKSIVKGGLIGVIIGAVGGILFAPKSGKETRKDIKDAAVKANREAEKKLKDLHTELNEKADEAKKMATEFSGKAKEEVEDLAKRAEFAREKIGELITAVREFEADESEVDKAVKDGKEVVKKIKQSKTKKK
jgi:gas vesicle protein